jgi:Mg-chelatase subunit ChlD
MKKTLEWTHPALHLVQRALVAAVAIIAAVGLLALPATAFAEDSTLDAPVHSKSAQMNADGTIDITLNVTGNSKQHSETSQADVIVVMDLSASMSESTSDGTRISIAKSAVDSLATQLLANNTTAHPDAVHLSLVTFGSYASTSITGTNSLSTFKNAVDHLSPYSSDARLGVGGTNWEDALDEANNVETRSNASKYIIFVSDGNPTFRNTRGTYDWRYDDPNEFRARTVNGHTIYGTGSSDGSGLNYQSAADVASSIQGKTLFSVGVFGDATKMQNLANAAGSTYYDATNSTALNNAFNDIVKTITTDVSYKDVSISDPIKSEAVEFCQADGTVDGGTHFTYKKDDQDWDGAPTASIVGNTVNWDLTKIGNLETGVKYSVSFKVRLKQEAYDAAAAGDTTFDAYDAAASTDGTYQVFTNDNGTLSYKVITSSSDGTTSTSKTKTADYDNQHVAVPVSTLHISKTWTPNGATLPTSLTVNVMRNDKSDVYKTVTLNAGNSWAADVKVAAGPEGHTYSVAEDTSALTGWDSTISPSSVTLQGLNEKRGEVALTNIFKTGTLTLTKNVKGNAANTNEEFTFTLTCEALKGKTYGDFVFNDSGVATVTLKNGDTKSGAKIPDGSQIAISETTETPHAENETYVSVTENGVSVGNKQKTKDYTAIIGYEKTTGVTYTNQSQLVPDTGLDISTTSQGVLLGVAAAGAATLAAAAIRKSHGERKEK